MSRITVAEMKPHFYMFINVVSHPSESLYNAFFQRAEPRLENETWFPVWLSGEGGEFKQSRFYRYILLYGEILGWDMVMEPRYKGKQRCFIQRLGADLVIGLDIASDHVHRCR